jgi:hypothetical protein
MNHKHTGGVIRHSPPVPRGSSHPTNNLPGGTHSQSYIQGGQMDHNVQGQTGAGGAQTGPVPNQQGNPVIPPEYMPR